MALTDSSAVSVGGDLLASLTASLSPQAHKGRVKRYLEGAHDLPYAPPSAQVEYRRLAQRSVTNWLPLISDTFAKGLFVDGYRPAKSVENAAPWDYWQANGLDARQTIAHRGALEYGTSYVLVLPGDPDPLIRPLSPLRTEAFYADPDDEYPVVGLVLGGVTQGGAQLVKLYDEANVWTLVVEAFGDTPTVVGAPEAHGLGVTPLVRFRDRLDTAPHGIIRPLIVQQDRINEHVFSLMIALQYASFRQRWATGLAIPVDADGVPIEPFEAAVDRLWATDNPEARFGDFNQTDTRGHLEAYMGAVRSLASVSQVSPHVLTGDLVNISADALAAIEASTQRKLNEYETLFGESWEQTLRLAALADGNEAAAQDKSAQVRWRDTEARSMALTVEALGKMAQLLGVPVEGLWPRVPGVTEQDVEEWKSLREKGDVFGALVSDMTKQAAPVTEPPAA